MLKFHSFAIVSCLGKEAKLWSSDMPPVYSDVPRLGSVAPNFQLPGVDGKTYQLNDFLGSLQETRILVVTFMCNHCPYVIAVQGRINALAKEYYSRGVRLVGINSNDSIRYPDDSMDGMGVRAREQGFAFPYLRDESQSVAKDYGAVCTPEFYAYLQQGEKFILKYQGRLDDSWKDEKAVQTRELAHALDQLLQGKDPDVDQKPAMGCSIKWKQFEDLKD